MRLATGQRQRPLLYWLIILGVVASAGACKRSASVTRTAYIIGPGDDILPMDEKVEKKVKPDLRHGSVLIATRLKSKSVKFCSGTLIDPDVGEKTYRVLTNHHCFAVPGEDGKATPDVLVEACTNTTAYFGFEPKTESEIPLASCKPGSLRTNYEGDVAVFTLTSNPPAPYKPLPLATADEVAAGTKAVIIHYPDVPERAAVAPSQKVKLPTMSVTVDNCEVTGTFAVEEWPLDRTLPFSLRHTCDLIHGSSGSALFDAETGEILGVNWGGIKISYAEEIRTDNVATKASYVRSFLERKSDDEIAHARTRINAQNHDADAKRSEATGSGIGDKAKKTFCGRIGSDRAAPWSAILFLIPFMVLFSGRKERKCGEFGT